MKADGTNFNLRPLPQFPTITPKTDFAGFAQNNAIGNLASTILGALLGGISAPSMPNIPSAPSILNPPAFSMFSQLMSPLAGFFGPFTLPNKPQINNLPVESETAATKPDPSELYPAELKPKVEEAKAKLAKKLGVSVDSVKVTKFRELRSAYHLTFEVQGKTYRGTISRINGEISIDPKPAETTGTETSYPAELKPKIAEARAKLAKKLGVSIDSVKLVSVGRIKYPDDPMIMLHHMNPGYTITFEVNGKKYATSVYDLDLNKPDKPVPTPTEVHEDPYPAELKPKIAEARAILARKLDVPITSVKITDFKEAKSAYLLTFEVQGKTYRGTISRINGEISIDPKPIETNEVEISYPADLKPHIQKAKAKLAERLGVSIKSVKLVGVEEIKYNQDPSIMLYHQTPGYVLTFEVNGKKHTRHIYPALSGNIEPFDDNITIKPKPTFGENMWKNSIAKRLGISEDSIEIIGGNRISPLGFPGRITFKVKGQLKIYEAVCRYMHTYRGDLYIVEKITDAGA